MRRADPGAVAHAELAAIGARRQAVARRVAVTRSVAVADARPDRMAIATVGTPGPDVRTGAVAAVIAIVRAAAIAIRAGHVAFLVGPPRRPVAGTGIGRALVDIIILLFRIGQPLAGPAAASGVAAAVGCDWRNVD